MVAPGAADKGDESQDEHLLSLVASLRCAEAAPAAQTALERLEAWPITDGQVRRTKVGRTVREVCRAFRGTEGAQALEERGKRLVGKWMAVFNASCAVSDQKAAASPARPTAPSPHTSGGSEFATPDAKRARKQTGDVPNSSATPASNAADLTPSKVPDPHQQLDRIEMAVQAMSAMAKTKKRVAGDDAGRTSQAFKKPSVVARTHTLKLPHKSRFARLSKPRIDNTLGSSSGNVHAALPPPERNVSYDPVARRWYAGALGSQRAGAKVVVECGAVLQYAPAGVPECSCCKKPFAKGTLRLSYPTASSNAWSQVLREVSAHLPCLVKCRPLVGLRECDVLGFDALKASEQDEARFVLQLRRSNGARSAESKEAAQILNNRSFEFKQLRARVSGRSVYIALTKWRAAAAAKEHTFPWYIVCEETLMRIADSQPRTLPDLRAINGIGQAKADEYGEQILAELRRAERKSKAHADMRRMGSDRRSTREAVKASIKARRPRVVAASSLLPGAPTKRRALIA